MDTSNMISFIFILLGGFGLYSAITGKGPAYKNDYPEKIREEALKMLRVFYWIMSPFALLSGVVGYFNFLSEGATFVIRMLGIGVIVVSFIVYVIMFRTKYGKYQ
jgi:hypothetical protein